MTNQEILKIVLTQTEIDLPSRVGGNDSEILRDCGWDEQIRICRGNVDES